MPADRADSCVDRMGNPIINQSEVYSGMYGRVNVTFYPYMFGGKKGIGCGLGPVQKLRDGEALGGSSMTAAQAFGAPQPAAPAQPMYAAPQPQAYVQPQQPTGQAPWGQPTAAPVNPLTGMPY